MYFTLCTIANGIFCIQFLCCIHHAKLNSHWTTPKELTSCTVIHYTKPSFTSYTWLQPKLQHTKSDLFQEQVTSVLRIKDSLAVATSTQHYSSENTFFSYYRKFRVGPILVFLLTHHLYPHLVNGPVPLSLEQCRQTVDKRATCTPKSCKKQNLFIHPGEKEYVANESRYEWTIRPWQTQWYNLLTGAYGFNYQGGQIPYIVTVRTYFKYAELFHLPIDWICKEVYPWMAAHVASPMWKLQLLYTDGDKDVNPKLETVKWWTIFLKQRSHSGKQTGDPGIIPCW